MARKRPIPDREKQIAHRLADARKKSFMGQTAFALRLGISRERYVSYELGTVPLQLRPGLKACEILDCSVEWLASGSLPSAPFVHPDLSKLSFSVIPAKALFSMVIYDLMGNRKNSPPLGIRTTLSEAIRVPSGAKTFEETVDFSQAMKVILRRLTPHQLLECSREIIANAAMTNDAKLFWVKILSEWFLSRSEFDSEFAQLSAEAKIAYRSKTGSERGTGATNKEAV